MTQSTNRACILQGSEKPRLILVGGQSSRICFVLSDDKQCSADPESKIEG
jgi:hypothetical protein